MLCHRRHLILLYSLLLIPFLLRSQQRRQDTLILHFPFDSYEVQPADRMALDTLKSLGANLVLITGYTDKIGTQAYNKRLSRQRANTAARILGSGWPLTIGGGIAPTPERTDSDNRRVEIVYYKIAAPQDDAVPHDNTVPHYDTITRRRPNPGPEKANTSNDSIVVVKSPPVNGATMDSTRPEAVLALHHINFIVDTPIPTDSTSNILPELVTELEQFREHHLEIDGYVNSLAPLRGPKDPLFILSVNRAKFIYDYLVNAGFDPAKLSFKGMGNATPINPNPTTKKEMNANMRVEIKVF